MYSSWSSLIYYNFSFCECFHLYLFCLLLLVLINLVRYLLFYQYFKVSNDELCYLLFLSSLFYWFLYLYQLFIYCLSARYPLFFALLEILDFLFPAGSRLSSVSWGHNWKGTLLQILCFSLFWLLQVGVQYICDLTSMLTSTHLSRFNGKFHTCSIWFLSSELSGTHSLYTKPFHLSLYTSDFSTIQKLPFTSSSLKSFTETLWLATANGTLGANAGQENSQISLPSWGGSNHTLSNQIWMQFCEGTLFPR